MTAVECGAQNYTAAEQEKNQLLRDQKWRAWRHRCATTDEDSHRPLWLPPLQNESTFNISYTDHNDDPFPAETGRTEEEAIDNTVEAYVKFQLDILADRSAWAPRGCLRRLFVVFAGPSIDQICAQAPVDDDPASRVTIESGAARWHDMMLEWDAARHSPEDPSVSPWMERNGYKIRFRHSHAGFCEHLEVKWDEDDFICGSPAARKEVEEEINESLLKAGPNTCDDCDPFDNSEVRNCEPRAHECSFSLLRIASTTRALSQTHRHTATRTHALFLALARSCSLTHTCKHAKKKKQN
eukprot:811030-Rhodomonas_salina.1